jgi:MFS family permease
MSSGNLFGDAGALRAPAASSQPHFDLRPLSTGEVLDRTFQLYRSRFTLFAGLALLPAAVGVVMNAARLLYAAHQDVHAHAGASLYRVQILTGAISLIAWLISMLLYGITQAASTWAVSAVYLGEAASIRAAYKVGFKHWLRYTLIVLRQVWAFMWLPFVLLIAAFLTAFWLKRHESGFAWLTIFLVLLVFLSLIYSVWAYIRVSMAIPAAVVESLKVRAAVRRSAQLLADRKVRIFLLMLLLVALYIVAGVIQSPLLIFAVRARGTQAFVTQAISLSVSFVAGTLIGPVGAIAICLFYFDERVRREGFDIEWMMKKLAPAAAGGPEPPPQTQEISAEPI